jgi:hypothetical protein
MRANDEPAVRGLWALAWRSVVYLPLMLATFVVLLAHTAALVVLPVFTFAFARSAFWTFAVGSLLLWLLALWSWKRFRLWEQFHTPWNSP